MNMKKLLIIVLALASLVQANAQIVPGMKYKELKDMYDPKMYVPQGNDPYYRAVSGVASLIIPGLGQVLCGEIGRGLIFFGGNLALSATMSSAAKKFSASVTTDADGNVTGYTDEAAAKSSSKLLVGAVVADVALCIWSCCDAIRVAKVKNMYYQDLYNQRSSVTMNLEPYFAFTPTEMTASGNSLQPTAGMTLKMNF